MRGEGDVFAGVENLEGDTGDDRLTGDGGANELSGHEGSDQLAGGPGPDVLSGGLGRDDLSGGSGHDRIFVDDSERAADDFLRDRDRIFCGPGVDTITEVSRADLIARDCEKVDLDLDDGATIRPYPVAVRGGVARFAVPCPARRGCRGSVRLRRADARLSLIHI